MVTSTSTLLTCSEVADMFRVSREAIYMQRHRGEGIGTLGFKVGRKILFRPEDIHRWIDEQMGIDSE